MLHSIPIEICINCSDEFSVQRSVRAAFDGGADRIELCSRMDVQGLTPAVEHIRIARQIFSKCGLLVMIRPRPGDFNYSLRKVDQMCAEIEEAAAAGADGVVLGAVRQGRLYLPVLKRLVHTTHEHQLAATFHRAFDSLEDPLSAVQALIDLGVKRILTSGAPWSSTFSALEGIEQLQQVIHLAGKNIEIVIGGGISHENVRTVLEKLAPEDALVSVHAYSSVLNGEVANADRVRALVSAVNVAALR